MRVERTDDGWNVTPPGFRFDIAIEADLVEEVARLTGYDQIPEHRPLSDLMLAAQPEAHTPLSQLRSMLVGRGYREAITYSFVSEADQQALDPGTARVSLLNPISSDMSVMRTSIWPGLLDALRYNLKRQRNSVRLFECGLVFRLEDSNLVQKQVLSGAITGDALPEQWGVESRGVDFFDLKGDVEALLSSTVPESACRFDPSEHAALHPGRSATVYCEDDELGCIGQLHPSVLTALKLSAPVYVFELDLTILSKGRIPQYQAISRFPTVRRDIAVVLDESISATAVRDCVGQSASDMLKNLELFDVYRGKGIDSGKKSLALSLTFQATSRTLRDEEIDDLMSRIVASLRDDLGGNLRG
jgi:phenylalanyl-tRNA synthetase beta chain